MPLGTRGAQGSIPSPAASRGCNPAHTFVAPYFFWAQWTWISTGPMDPKTCFSAARDNRVWHSATTAPASSSSCVSLCRSEPPPVTARWLRSATCLPSIHPSRYHGSEGTAWKPAGSPPWDKRVHRQSILTSPYRGHLAGLPSFRTRSSRAIHHS